MRQTQSRHGGANVRLPPPFVFLGAVVAGFLLQRFARPYGFPLAPGLRILTGAALVAAGLALGIPAVALFRRSGQDPAPWKPTPELVFRGPYRFTRNPMYVGLTALTLGIGLWANAGWVAALALPALFVVHLTAVLPEEAYLRDRFGAAYERYLMSVRRYL